MSSPPVLHREIVLGEWVDYNNHMNVAYYVLIFDHATDAFLDLVGLNESYRKASGGSIFVVESHIIYGQEILQGTSVEISTHLLNVDDKRMHLFHTMRPAGSDDIAATIEIMALHVDLTTRKSAPFPSDIKSHLQQTADQHLNFAAPTNAGRQIRF